MKEKKYEEVGTNYRFFLGWRHASLAGILVIVYGVLFLTIEVYKQIPILACLIPLFGSPIGILFWIIDVRTRKLYHSAIIAGKKLEGLDGGFFSELSKVALPPESKSWEAQTQSLALDILFWGTSIILLFIASLILIIAICKTVLP